MKKILFFCLLILITTSCEVVSKNRYFEVNHDHQSRNCGAHFATHEAAKYILKGHNGDFKGNTLIIKENLIFNKKSKLSIFTDDRFLDKLFEKDFNLTF